jgi:hypothetical protein
MAGEEESSFLPQPMGGENPRLEMDWMEEEKLLPASGERKDRRPSLGRPDWPPLFLSW